MSRFLILQLRPEDEAADLEFAAFLEKGGLEAAQTHRLQLDRQDLPPGLDPAAYAGVIVGGGPGCVSDDPSTRDPVEARAEAQILGLMAAITDRDLPFLGCCYGISILAAHLGAPVSKARYGEGVGAVPCRVTEAGRADPLLARMPRTFDALVGHKEAVQALPEGAVHLVEGEACPFQMIRHGANVYATQFHPEADGAEFAARIRIYRDKGYFAPDEAAALTRAVLSARTASATHILQAFVARYR